MFCSVVLAFKNKSVSIVGYENAAMLLFFSVDYETSLKHCIRKGVSR